MNRNILLLIVTAGLIFFNAGCTSQESTDEQAPIENADVEKIDAPATDARTAGVADTTATTADDKSLEASLDEPTVSTAATTAPAPATPPAEVATAPAPVAPAESAPATPPTMDDSSLNLGDAPAPATDVAAATEAPAPAVEAPAAASTELTETPVTDTAATAAMNTSTEVSASPVAAKSSGGGAIKKVATTVPYQNKDGGWVNTIYIVRPKEKLADISQKIFGADKTADLKKIAENKYLKSRAVKAGDKIYYVSPNRPEDASKTMLYFEDMGMVPETYVAKKGESLRKVAKELLGYDNAWKELWSSNSIESKTSLKDGETLRYWKSTDAVAAAATPPPATLVDASQAPVPTAQTAPPQALPPPPADANAAMPPPPPADAAAATATPPPAPNVAAAPPPPPPPADDAAAASPPPPAPADDAAAAPAAGVAKKAKVNLDEEAANEESPGGLDTETLASMGALGVLVALLAFVIIRKKKQKSQMNNLEMNA